MYNVLTDRFFKECFKLPSVIRSRKYNYRQYSDQKTKTNNNTQIKKQTNKTNKQNKTNNNVQKKNKKKSND